MKWLGSEGGLEWPGSNEGVPSYNYSHLAETETSPREWTFVFSRALNPELPSFPLASPKH